MNYLTGFADEAAADIAGQIRATQELGWENIEVRNVNGTNLHDLSDADFDAAAGALTNAGIHVNCFGSAIANWGRHFEKVPFDTDLDSAKRAVIRMKRLGTTLIRIMSYPIFKDADGRTAADQMVEERIRRLNILVPMFTSEGLLPVHENCGNYGGMSWKHTLELLERVPGMKLVYDTGNPVFSDDFLAADPTSRKQSSWEFYDHVKDHVVYVHIKDGVFGDGKVTYCWPGDGEGDVRRICADLLARGYAGGFSMEPHMQAVPHLGTASTDEEAKFNTYVEYGRRFVKLLKELQ